jgi:pseudouridine synthase
LDGKPLRKAAPVYILLYKPKGYLTTWRDPEGRPTVYDLIRDAGGWLSPVGRLDLDTSGLLIMTNDNGFAERLTNPDYKAAKTYQIKAGSLLSDEQLEQLRRGVSLEDGPTRPAIVTRLRDGPRNTFLEMTITEGRNRQVRRMLEAVGSKVRKLVRIAIGPIRIGDLPIGKWRRLTAGEIGELNPRPVQPARTPANRNTSGSRQPPRSTSPARNNRYSKTNGSGKPEPRRESRPSRSDTRPKRPGPRG